MGYQMYCFNTLLNHIYRNLTITRMGNIQLSNTHVRGYFPGSILVRYMAFYPNRDVRVSMFVMVMYTSAAAANYILQPIPFCYCIKGVSIGNATAEISFRYIRTRSYIPLRMFHLLCQ